MEVIVAIFGVTVLGLGFAAIGVGVSNIKDRAKLSRLEPAERERVLAERERVQEGRSQYHHGIETSQRDFQKAEARPALEKAHELGHPRALTALGVLDYLDGNRDTALVKWAEAAWRDQAATTLYYAATRAEPFPEGLRNVCRAFIWTEGGYMSPPRDDDWVMALIGCANKAGAPQYAQQIVSWYHHHNYRP